MFSKWKWYCCVGTCSVKTITLKGIIISVACVGHNQADIFTDEKDSLTEHITCKIYKK